MVVGGGVSELSHLDLVTTAGSPSRLLFTVGQTLSSRPSPELLTQTLSSHLIYCLLRTRYCAECFTFFKLTSSAAHRLPMRKCGKSNHSPNKYWDSNPELPDSGDICFLQLGSPLPTSSRSFHLSVWAPCPGLLASPQLPPGA